MQKTTFKKTYSKQQRAKMFTQAQAKDQGLVVVVVEMDPKCKVFPELKHNRFKIKKDSKFFEMYTAIRSRILEMGEKYQNHSLFLFSNKVLPNKEMSFGQLWTTQKDPEDNLLYLKYSNMEPFGK